MDDLSSNAWDKFEKSWQKDAKIYNFSVYTKTATYKPVLNRMRKGNGISYLQGKLRLVEGLRSLYSSVLYPEILCPKKEGFETENPNTELGHSMNSYSNSPRTAIAGIKGGLLTGQSKRTAARRGKILLLQGPPGTGKSHTILGLIQELVTADPNMRILLVAPSNAAIDEIGSRLIKLKCDGWPIRCVRVGNSSLISSVMKPHTLDALVRKPDDEFQKKEIRDVEKQIEYLKRQKPIDTWRMQTLIERLQHLKSAFANKHANSFKEHRNRDEQVAILRDCNVVLTTLGSCRMHMLTYAFNESCRFSCCIIDEATQSTELEVLQVLSYGISKLVLVGDHKQLPASVNSEIAIACKYQRSMFERFHEFFSSQPNWYNPVLMLTEQFRMHSEICKFPSAAFYNNRLITAVTNDLQCRNFPLNPYIVLNLLNSEEQNSAKSKTNNEEALVVVKICSELLNLQSDMTIGIITPYAAQKDVYASCLSVQNAYKHIEIDTVDAFQGREKDVIILSCVRANTGTIGFLSDSKRLNVAITRAKKSLIVCCHADTLMQASFWANLIRDARNRNVYHSIVSHNEVPSVFATNMMKKKAKPPVSASSSRNSQFGPMKGWS